MRVLVTGIPCTQMDKFAERLAGQAARVRHTDDLVADINDWSLQSQTLATWFDEPAPWLIEGCMVPRAIRKWLLSHPSPEIPAEVVFWLDQPVEPMTEGQERFAKGNTTIWLQVVTELIARGVTICGIRS